MSKKDAAVPERVIAVNRRARFEYFIEERYEAGLVLKGWEVKSLRAGRAQIAEAYVVIKNREAWLIGAHFTPLKQTSTHEIADSTRTRKLLLHERELADRQRVGQGKSVSVRLALGGRRIIKKKTKYK